MSELNFVIIGITLGLIAGLNGTVAGGYTTYLATKLGDKKSTSQVTGGALLVLAYMAMLLIITSLAVATIIESLSVEYQRAMLVLAPCAAIVVGLLYIRQYFWHKPIVQLQHHKYFAKKHLAKQTSLLQPLAVAATLLYLASPIILAHVTLMSLLSLLTGNLAVFWAAFYSLGIITPLYFMTGLLLGRTKVSRIISWLKKTKGTLALYAGISAIALAWIVFYVAIVEGVSGL